MNAMKNTRENSLLRSEDVAAYLGVSRSYVYRLLSSGEIRSVRMGRAVRVLQADLDEYIKTHLMAAAHRDQGSNLA